MLCEMVEHYPRARCLGTGEHYRARRCSGRQVVQLADRGRLIVRILTARGPRGTASMGRLLKLTRRGALNVLRRLRSLGLVERRGTKGPWSATAAGVRWAMPCARASAFQMAAERAYWLLK